MKLAIHGLRLSGPLTGVTRYLLSLLDEWKREPGMSDDICVYTHRPLNKQQLIRLQETRYEALSMCMPYILAEQLLLPRKAKAADVLFCPAFTIPIGYRRPCVVTIHDTLLEVMPESFPFWARLRYAPLFRYSARHATIVLTDSQSSKRDILRFYQVPEEKVRVTPLAAAPCFRLLQDRTVVEEARQRYGLGEDPFVLFVGKLSARRNIPMLLEAFSRTVGASNLPHRLVLVGVNHLHLPLQTLIARTGLTRRVIHVEEISDEDLTALYNAADTFVLPSLYEGFGLPPLEAMACGCPTILFRNSSLAEVGGDAAAYPTSSDFAGLSETLRLVLTSGSLRQDLQARGLERAKLFSWTRTARQVRGALEEAAS